MGARNAAARIGEAAEAGRAGRRAGSPPGRAGDRRAGDAAGYRYLDGNDAARELKAVAALVVARARAILMTTPVTLLASAGVMDKAITFGRPRRTGVAPPGGAAEAALALLPARPSVLAMVAS